MRVDRISVFLSALVRVLNGAALSKAWEIIDATMDALRQDVAASPTPTVYDKRHVNRCTDGTPVEMSMVASDERKVVEGLIVDVNKTGARMWSPRQIAPGQNIWCRINLDCRCTHLALKVLWSKPVSRGFELGACTTSSIPGSGSLMSNYAEHVGHRRSRPADEIRPQDRRSCQLCGQGL